jgi:hypothetical protein
MAQFTDEQLEAIDEAVENLRPEAKEYVTSLDAIRLRTTKDNYGEVLQFLVKLQKDAGTGAPLFLVAMVREGYPLVTATQLVGLLGWNTASVNPLLSRAYLEVA